MSQTDIADRSRFQIPEVLAKELARFLEQQIVFGEIPPTRARWRRTWSAATT